MLSQCYITLPTVNCHPIASEVVFWAILFEEFWVRRFIPPKVEIRVWVNSYKILLDQMSKIKNRREVTSTLQIENDS